MKRACFIIQFLLLIPLSSSFSQVVLFSEGFESGELPLNWSQQFTSGAVNWKYEDGGHTYSPAIPNSRNPVSAHGGEYNALFQFTDMNIKATKLITKKIEALGFAIKPELHFFHAQFTKTGYNDKLKVYYKSSINPAWTLLQTYNESTSDWVERIILLPEGDLSSDYYLAFEGQISSAGYGTCVDDIQIIETGILQKNLSEISVEQASEVSVASGTANNPILKITLKVMGNSGSLPLNSLALTSLNISDADIETGGVKIYHTQGNEFHTGDQIGSGVNFVSGQAEFNSLNYDLPPGYSYLWITYDLKTTAAHRNTIDASLAVNSININGLTYFNEVKSPAGSRTVLQTLHTDDFESPSDWVLSGEFQYGSPLGKGGTQGNPDPNAAFSGNKIIGTDLTGLGDYAGDYEKGLESDEYSAISDTFDFTYYNDLSLRYMRYLNIGVNDEAFIEVSSDSGSTWKKAWSNTSMVLDDNWKLHELDINKYAARKNNVLVKFTIGTTNDYWQLSGWNIDDFSITGNYVSKDVGISQIVAPLEGCGNTASESVSVIITNFGAFDSHPTIPLQYSFDGNTTITYDTLYQVIPFGASVPFTFKKKADLSKAGIYSFVVSTGMNGDDDASNDAIEKKFYVQPTIETDFKETFESNSGLWMVKTADNSSWECGEPGYGIDPPSGARVWMTGLSSDYLNNDSSFVEGVCYGNPDKDRKILRLSYWVSTEADADGAAVQYSTDNGINWQLLDTLISGWDWYTTANVQALNTKGWSGNSAGWKTARLVLPKAVTDSPTMKFRLAFASNPENSNIGFAFDDFGITTVPHDIGVLQIDSFADACQFINPDQLTVTIKNFGINTLTQQDTLIVAFDMNHEKVAVDTFQLSDDLLPGKTVKHTFENAVNVVTPGNYNLTAYTLIEDDPHFFGTNNDTATVDFEIFANPITLLIDTIQTHVPDTVVLRPYFNMDYDYLWGDASIADTFDVEEAGWHFLTVTATRGNGCSSYDSSYVELLFSDLGADGLLSPVDGCGLTNAEYITVRIRNFGTDSIAVGQKIAVLYELDGGSPVSDTLRLPNTLYAGDLIDFTFTKGPVDVSQKGTYDFKIFTEYGGDTIAVNDTVIRSVVMKGRPAVNLGPDKTVEALSYTIDAGSGFVSYSWDNGITTQTREITQTGNFWVQVFDENQCDNYDTTYIRLKIRDISPAGFVSPVSDCHFDPAVPVELRILNSGTDTIPAGTSVAVSYVFQEGTRINETEILSAALLPGDFTIHTFPSTLNLNSAADYAFEATAVTTGDLRTTNDTSDITIYRYAKPVIDFGFDKTEYVYDISLPIEAGLSPHYNYVWQDGSSEHHYTATTSGLCHVIATDMRTNCFDRDSVTVYLLYGDVGITWTDIPLNGCTGDYDNVRVKVKNQGTSNIGKDAPIYIACDVNGIRVTVDTLVRTGNFAIGASLELTLSGKVKISTGGISQVAFYTLYADDKKKANDTLTVEFDALPGPVVDFGDVNGWLTVDLPHVLDAGADHKSYLWQDASSAQTFTVVQNGIYSVTLTGQNDCQTIKTVRINMPNGVEDIPDKIRDAIIYPNPNSGLFNIDIDEELDNDLTVRVINSQGQTVYIREFRASDLDREQIDVQQLPGGFYQVLIMTDKRTYLGKMIIQ